jgi:bacterioferritin-associated ferredoxin
MYVCICRGISDKDIEKAMITHSSTRDVLKSLGVGSDCGQCVIDAIDIIKQNHNRISISKSEPRQNESNSQ